MKKLILTMLTLALILALPFSAMAMTEDAIAAATKKSTHKAVAKSTSNESNKQVVQLPTTPEYNQYTDIGKENFATATISLKRDENDKPGTQYKTYYILVSEFMDQYPGDMMGTYDFIKEHGKFNYNTYFDLKIQEDISKTKTYYLPFKGLYWFYSVKIVNGVESKPTPIMHIDVTLRKEDTEMY